MLYFVKKSIEDFLHKVFKVQNCSLLLIFIIDIILLSCLWEGSAVNKNIVYKKYSFYKKITASY